ncbi:MAG: hypothetical protein IJF90_01080 [Synergistaceae bacterium]|nr:hypothetical protein [Synergistaceae bacterium]
MVIIQGRRTNINIQYQGQDITKDIAPSLLSFSFTDNAKGQADDIAITLEDRGGLWLHDWTPSKGDTITASIIQTNGTKTQSLPCGSFSIDQIEYSCPPAVLSIKAVSSSVKKTASQVKKTRSWENVTLREVCADIASGNNLALLMDSYADGRIERIDQIQQSDLDFLRELCADYGQAVKIQEGRIVVYDLEEYEGKEPVMTLMLDDERLLSFKFTSKDAKIVRKVTAKYHHPLRDETYEGEYLDDYEEGSDRYEEIAEYLESQADAEQTAKERCIETNRKEITGSMTLIGDVNIAAGVVIDCVDFGAFSGKHFVTKAGHKVDRAGYVVSLELGMPQAEKGKARSRKKAGQTQTESGGLYYEGDAHY